MNKRKESTGTARSSWLTMRPGTVCLERDGSVFTFVETVRQGEHNYWSAWFKRVCGGCGRVERISATQFSKARLHGRAVRCRSCVAKLARPRPPEYTDDYVLSSGCIIRYSHRTPERWDKARVPITCVDCSNDFWVSLDTAYRYRKGTSRRNGNGRCRDCARMHADEVNGRLDGDLTTLAPSGYRYVLVKRIPAYFRRAGMPLPDNWREIIRPMMRYNGQILEHRMLMALSMGRSLSSTEFVHHKDLSRDANVLSNLEQTSRAAHPTEHAAIPRRAQKELMRLYDLLDEYGIPHRKQLLRHLPWEYQEQVRQNYRVPA